jgi:hypothetical protein
MPWLMHEHTCLQPTMPVYRSGVPPARAAYSTLHTCMLPAALPDAMLWLSWQAARQVMRPDCAE